MKRIRWRHTVLETRDWGTLIVPNAVLLQGQILVLGKRSGKARGIHRYWVYFNVDFRFAPTRVIEVVDEALQMAPVPNVAADPKPHCICYDFASPGRDSFAYYAVRYWLTDLAQDDPTNSVVRTRIYAALRRANIPLAMPTHTTFYAPGGPDEEERKLGATPAEALGGAPLGVARAAHRQGELESLLSTTFAIRRSRRARPRRSKATWRTGCTCSARATSRCAFVAMA